MASEEQKKQNQLRLTSMALTSLAQAVWETLGESAFSYSGLMGDELLRVMEKEMGLEIAGHTPKEVIMEVSRIFVDEFGYASDIEVEGDDDTLITLKVRQCINRKFSDRLDAAGVEKPFICPIMNACQAGLRRLGYKMREEVHKWHEGGGSIITFERVA
ncbi:hypothetical protein Ctha_0397 [Chloroherpeton thalassium ATCC 35110]|uniref:Uncharacterized protein n=2 Tax=Chloroherpeton thalassium TaxID=100716 RepID=B3QU70_CHLT3|nr:hypothetical protein Ctha_0397 [Chloroherpeton thalassium ATCC 35110]